MSRSHDNRKGTDAGGASKKGPSGPVGKEAIEAALKKQQHDQQQSRAAKKPDHTSGPSKQATSPTHRPEPEAPAPKTSSQPSGKTEGKPGTSPGKPTSSSLSTRGNTRPPAPKKAAFVESYTQTRVEQPRKPQSGAPDMVFVPKKPADGVATSPSPTAKTPPASTSGQAAGAQQASASSSGLSTPKAPTASVPPSAPKPTATTPKATTPNVPPAAPKPTATTPKATTSALSTPAAGPASDTALARSGVAHAESEREVSSDLRPVDPPRPAPNKQIKITEKAINKIVGQAICSVPGVIAINGGMEKMTGRNYPRYDLALDDDGDAVSVNAHIAVGWPAPVADVAQKVRETIITWVSDMTDVPVSHAHVTVGLVEPGHERTTPTQLAAFNPHPVLTPVSVNTVAPSVAVVTRTINDSVRSIPVPTPAALVAFNAGKSPEVTHPTVTSDVNITSPTVSEPVPLKDIEVSEPIQLQDIKVSESPEIAPVVVAESNDLTPITVAEPVPLKPISLSDSTSLAAVEVKDSATLSTVTVSPFGDLKPVTVRDQKPLATVTTRPSELTKITVSSTPLTEVRQPTPVPVSRVVSPTGHRLADVTAPTPMRLAEIVTDRKPLSRVQQPTPHRLATVKAPDEHRVTRPKTPQAPRLKRIVTKGMRVQETPRVDATPLRKTPVPPERDLRPIVVRSPKLKTIKVVTKK